MLRIDGVSGLVCKDEAVTAWGLVIAGLPKGLAFFVSFEACHRGPDDEQKLRMI